MIDDIEIEQAPSKENRVYLSLIGIVFIISNTIALSIFIIVLFGILGTGLQRVFYWTGVALLTIFTYPKFQRAKPKNKHLMLIASIAILIMSIEMVYFL